MKPLREVLSRLRQLFRSDFNEKSRDSDCGTKSVWQQLCDINPWKTTHVTSICVTGKCTKGATWCNWWQSVAPTSTCSTPVNSVSKVHTNGPVDKYMRAANSSRQAGWFHSFLTAPPNSANAETCAITLFVWKTPVKLRNGCLGLWEQFDQLNRTVTIWGNVGSYFALTIGHSYWHYHYGRDFGSKEVGLAGMGWYMLNLTLSENCFLSLACHGTCTVTEHPKTQIADAKVYV